MRAVVDVVRARPGACLGGAALGAIALAVVLAPWLAPHDPNMIRPSADLRSPAWMDGGSAEHLLGTDQLGRDVLSRLLYGARSSLIIALGAVLLAATVGTLVGMFAGYFGGAVDAVLMRLADIQLAFPFILLALSLLSVAETRTWWTVMIVLAIADWVIHARVVRGRVIAEKELDYVQAARALGAGHVHVLRAYVLPSILPTILTIALLQLGVLMVVESVLAFVGLGIESPAVSWGTILADGRRSIATAWWLLLFPGVAIFVSVLGVNLLADGLPDLLDPRVTRRDRRTRSGEARIVPPGSPTLGGISSDGSAAAGTGAAPGTQPDASAPVLSVAGLRTRFGDQVAVRDFSLDVHAGERVGIVGESGSGKSVTFLSLLGLAPRTAQVIASRVSIEGRNVRRLDERSLRPFRGHAVTMIFQDPGAALNPTMRVAAQVREVLARNGVPRRDRYRAVLEALDKVRVRDPERVAASYPFQLSGGQQQRVMMAMAMAARPRLLVADEPTTALDVTTQSQILGELDRLTAEDGTAVVLISHDLGVVAEFTDRIVVLYNGMVCEVGSTAALMTRPRHPYTQSLLASVHELGAADSEPEEGAAPLVPDVALTPSPAGGCSFAPRCLLAEARCWESVPAMEPGAPDGDGAVACHLVPARPEVPVR